jgi:ATP-binding cassette subfamily F protein 3
MEDNINKFRASATKAFAQSLIKKLDKIERIEVENDDVSKFNIVLCKVLFRQSNFRS